MPKSIPFRKILLLFTFLLISFGTIAQTPDANNILYVNINVSGGNGSGNNWANAIPQLADALKYARQQNNYTAANPLKIYVAKGTYKPMYNSVYNGYTTDGGRNNSFVMVKNVQLYGGFDPEAGITTLLHHRIIPDEDGNPVGGGTILSGDIDNNNVLDAGNSCNVVISAGDVGNAILDGFGITKGYANQSGSVIVDYDPENSVFSAVISAHGAGIHCVNSSPVMTNVSIYGNAVVYSTYSSGGGVYNHNSNPVFSNVFISDNSASGSGGGVHNYNSNPVFIDVSISDNSADSGGGMQNYNSGAILTNVLISDNSADRGGGISNFHTFSPVLTNVKIRGNTATSLGGGVLINGGVDASPASFTAKNIEITGNSAGTNGSAVFHQFGSTTLTNATIASNSGPAVMNTEGSISFSNSIVYGSITHIGQITFQYSLAEGRNDVSNGNISASGVTINHLFRDAANGNFGLICTAPAIDKGSTALFSGLDANTKDIAKNPRLFNGTIDMGAYEYNILPDTNGIVYVNTVCSGIGDGSSWADATSKLHNAIHVANVQKVFVAKGNYNVGDNSFIMKNGVEIYGGFDPVNGITDLTHNRILPNPANSQGSVLNGQNLRPVIWNVFTSGTAMNNTAILDGFTITRGNYANGAGIRNVYASPTLTNIVIRANSATATGAGMYNERSSPLLTNAIISNNTIINLSVSPVANAYGAGIYNTTSSVPVITNTTITENQLQVLGTMGGAGIYNNNSSPRIYNSIIWNNLKSGNPAVSGADIENSSGTVTLRNSITQGYTTGDPAHNNKVNANPLFVGNYTLSPISPAINAGANNFYTGLNENSKDLAGKYRLDDGIIDMGAYELNLVPDANGIMYVKTIPTGLGNGSSWINATGSIQGAINGRGTQKVFVATGNYNVGVSSFVMKNNVEIYGGFDPDNGIRTLSDTRILPTDIIDGSVLNGQNLRGVIRNTFTSADPIDNTAVLDGFTITNGQTAGNTFGAGILNVFASPIFRHLVIKNNKLVSGGGAGMANISSSPMITDVVITGNEALRGGGMYNIDNSSPVLTDVIIKNNTATNTGSFGGGGMFNQLSTLVLDNVVIQNNTAVFTGGGIFAQSNSNLQMNNSRIEDNTALSGGGIYMNSSTLAFTDGTFKNNTVTSNGGGFYAQGTSNIQVSNTVIESNAAQNGGGIYISGSTSVLDEVALKSNTATNNGGGFLIQGNNSNIQVLNSAIEDNTAATAGGGIYIIGNTNTIQVSNATVEDNTALYGGGLYNNGAASQFTDIIFRGNSATMATAGSGGGAIFNQNSALALTNVLITNNSTNFQGGGFRNLSGNPVLTNVTFADNTAVTRTAIDVAGGTPQLYNTIVYGTIAGNIAPHYSLIEGRTNTDNGNINATGILLSHIFNDAANGDYSLKINSPAVNGGNNDLFAGLHVQTKDLAKNPRVYDFATGGIIDMGAYESPHADPLRPDSNSIIYVKPISTGKGNGNSWLNATADLHNSIHTAGVQKVFVAVGEYKVGENSFVMRKNVEIYGGFDPGSGISDLSHTRLLPTTTVMGSVLNGENVRPLIWNLFTAPTALDNTAVLDGFRIINGQNHNNGGGVYNVYASPVLKNLIISECNAKSGAGIYNEYSAPVLSNISIKNSNAVEDGGGIYNVLSSSPSLTNITITGNTANFGAGIFIGNTSFPAINHLILKNNTARFDGGGMYNDAASSPVITNAIIANNIGQNGAGIYNRNNSYTVLNNVTIAGNIGSNAFYATDGNSLLNNTIVYGGISEGIYTPMYSLIQNNTNTSNGNINATGILLSHIFNNAANGDYTLSPCSPAINTGNNSAIPAGITTDIAGNPRIAESRVDIGAYEGRGFSLHHTANSSLTATGYCQTPDGWRHFYHNDGLENKVFISIHPNGQNLGTVNTSTRLNEHYGDSSRILIDPYMQVPFHVPFNRSWILNASNTFSNPVGVRFYFADRDSMDLAQTIPVDSLRELIVYKVNGNNIWDISSTGYKRHLHGTVADTNTYIFNSYQGIRYAEFQVKSFSTGTLGFYDNTLPLDLLSFTGTAINDKTYLQWHTVNEQDVSHFRIERSFDARKWETLHYTSAMNGMEQHYDAWDDAPNKGINYYRLKMTDYDGTYKYSKIVEVSFGQGAHTPHYLIYPNPNNGTFYVLATDISSENTQMFLFDGLGRLAHSQQLQKGNNLINPKNLVSGIYMLKIESQQSTTSYKVVIE